MARLRSHCLRCRPSAVQRGCRGWCALAACRFIAAPEPDACHAVGSGRGRDRGWSRPMFPRLWVPQLRGHILSNFAWNTVLVLSLPVLYLLLPQIVAVGHGYLRGSGYVATELEQRIFADHWKIIGLSALFALGAAEVQGYLLRRAKAEPFINAPFQAMIAELAQRAGLPYTPAVIFIPQGPVNAAATQSMFFGGKVLVMGDILERLDAGEERVVFAHEMSHLVNRDIWPML